MIEQDNQHVVDVQNELFDFDIAGPNFRLYLPQETLPCGTVLAAKLSNNYFSVRDVLIQERINRVCKGSSASNALKNLRANFFDERVAEYVVFTEWLLQHKKVASVLDVGCVLNNKLLGKILPEQVDELVLCNPAKEKINIHSIPVSFESSTLDKASQKEHRYPLVTCLSTIEHIGYDNSQYGVTDKARFSTPQVDTLNESILQLADLTAKGGNLFISVPFGYREALIHPFTRKASSQVFDYESLDAAINILKEQGFQAELVVYQSFYNEWRQVAPENCQARYAENCPAASAVAFIFANRKEL